LASQSENSPAPTTSVVAERWLLTPSLEGRCGKLSSRWQQLVKCHWADPCLESRANLLVLAASRMANRKEATSWHSKRQNQGVCIEDGHARLRHGAYCDRFVVEHLQDSSHRARHSFPQHRHCLETFAADPAQSYVLAACHWTSFARYPFLLHKSETRYSSRQTRTTEHRLVSWQDTSFHRSFKTERHRGREHLVQNQIHSVFSQGNQPSKCVPCVVDGAVEVWSAEGKSRIRCGLPDVIFKRPKGTGEDINFTRV